jgi:hypothetical protein
VIRSRQIILCLLLGIATAIGVAVLLAAFRPVPMYPRQTIGCFEQWGRPWNVSEVNPVGVYDIWWMDLNADGAGPTDELVRRQREQIDQRPATIPQVRIRHSAPSWGTFHRRVEPAALIGSDTAFGFPFPCLWYTVVGDVVGAPASAPSIGGERIEGGLVLRGSVSCRGRDFAAIPLRVLWGRLAGDGLVWAGIWWVVVFVPRLVRRAIRRAKGRCPECGYQLGGLPAGARCPECGRLG